MADIQELLVFGPPTEDSMHPSPRFPLLSALPSPCVVKRVPTNQRTCEDGTHLAQVVCVMPQEYGGSRVAR